MRRIIANGNHRLLSWEWRRSSERCGFPSIVTLEFQGKGVKSNLALKAICFGILQKSEFHIILKQPHSIGFLHDFLLLPINRILTQARHSNLSLVWEASYALGSNMSLSWRKLEFQSNMQLFKFKKKWPPSAAIFLFYKTPFLTKYFVLYASKGGIMLRIRVTDTSFIKSIARYPAFKMFLKVENTFFLLL